MDFRSIIYRESQKDYYKTLMSFLDDEYENSNVFPPRAQIFRCFDLPETRIKAVIIGQDPYPRPGEANGLAFSVNEGVDLPKSLKNIYKAVKNDFGEECTKDLSSWARQGVLLLNTVLTVKEKEPGSHKGKGWETFTDTVIKALEQDNGPIVYMFWGNEAKKKAPLVTNPNHIALLAPHPSSRGQIHGFLECHHFKICNAFLEKHGETPIRW